MNDNQDAAQQALADIASIRDMINGAQTKTAEAREAMVGANGSAKLALSVAGDARTVADEASTKAGEIRQESESSREQADELWAAANSLAEKLDSTKDVVSGKEEVARTDGESALAVRTWSANLQEISLNVFLNRLFRKQTRHRLRPPKPRPRSSRPRKN